MAKYFHLTNDGFLPDFLANKFELHPVLWQPVTSQYRVLAVYRNTNQHMQERFDYLVHALHSIFSQRNS